MRPKSCLRSSACVSWGTGSGTQLIVLPSTSRPKVLAIPQTGRRRLELLLGVSHEKCTEWSSWATEARNVDASRSYLSQKICSLDAAGPTHVLRRTPRHTRFAGVHERGGDGQRCCRVHEHAHGATTRKLSTTSDSGATIPVRGLCLRAKSCTRECDQVDPLRRDVKAIQGLSSTQYLQGCSRFVEHVVYSLAGGGVFGGARNLHNGRARRSSDDLRS